jgi:hypothetical protein
VHTAITGSDYAIASDPPPAHKGNVMSLLKEIVKFPLHLARFAVYNFNLAKMVFDNDFDPRPPMSREIDRLEALKLRTYERLMSMCASREYQHQQLFGINKDVVFLKSDLKSLVEKGSSEEELAAVRVKLVAKDAKRQAIEEEIAAANVAIDAQRKRYEVVCYDRRNVGERFDQKETTCQQ